MGRSWLNKVMEGVIIYSSDIKWCGAGNGLTTVKTQLDSEVALALFGRHICMGRQFCPWQKWILSYIWCESIPDFQLAVATAVCPTDCLW